MTAWIVQLLALSSWIYYVLVLWTIYSDITFTFQAVSTDGCEILIFVLWWTWNFGILKSGQTGRMFSLFSWIGLKVA